MWNYREAEEADNEKKPLNDLGNLGYLIGSQQKSKKKSKLDNLDFKL